jgi:hypothetical protein
MKTQIVLLRIAGCISLLFMLFHFAFQKMFDWEHSLRCLSQVNLSILLTYHYASILITGFMALIPLFQTRELLESKLKYSILSMFAMFYLIRMVTEFTLFGFALPQSPVIIFMCAVPLIFYTFPLWSHLRKI